MRTSNANAEARREARFYAERQRAKCAVCGKHYIVRHKGWACSKRCKDRLDEIAKEH